MLRGHKHLEGAAIREEKRVTRGSDMIQTRTNQKQLDLADPNQRRTLSAGENGLEREGGKSGGTGSANLGLTELWRRVNVLQQPSPVAYHPIARSRCVA